MSAVNNSNADNASEVKRGAIIISIIGPRDEHVYVEQLNDLLVAETEKNFKKRSFLFTKYFLNDGNMASENKIDVSKILDAHFCIFVLNKISIAGEDPQYKNEQIIELLRRFSNVAGAHALVPSPEKNSSELSIKRNKDYYFSHVCYFFEKKDLHGRTKSLHALIKYIISNRSGKTLKALSEKTSKHGRGRFFLLIKSASLIIFGFLTCALIFNEFALKNILSLNEDLEKKLDSESQKLISMSDDLELKTREIDRLKNLVERRSRGFILGGETLAGGSYFTECEYCPQMIVVSPGVFQMGRSGDVAPGKKDIIERVLPNRTVSINYYFSMSKYEVTYGQYMYCVRAGACAIPDQPEDMKADNIPVVGVSYYDAKNYAKFLTLQIRKVDDLSAAIYQIPSEAEWEYVARAGTTGATHYDQKAQASKANVEQLDLHKVRDVFLGDENPWGFFDMIGNVEEWTFDCKSDDLSRHPSNGSAFSEPNCSEAVQRGGAWTDRTFHATSYWRNFESRTSKRRYAGFRVIRLSD